jgi:hypothetical protein
VPTVLDGPGEGLGRDDDGASGWDSSLARNEDGSLVQLTVRLYVSYTGTDMLKVGCGC